MPDSIPTDLHGHSFYSDGRIWPEELVAHRSTQDLSVIALSDHDTFAGVPRAAAAAREHGLTLVPAMEVTSFIHFGTDQAEQVHILAYYPPARLPAIDRSALGQRARSVHAKWRSLVLGWLDGLPEYERRAFDPDGAVRACEDAEFPALQMCLNLVMQRCPAVFESFRIAHIEMWDDPDLYGWTPEEAIDAIRADGALDVVAHPNRVRDKGRMDKVLRHASGIEVYTSRHNAHVAARFKDMAETLGKHWTASSDDHQQGPYMKPPEGTPRRTVEAIIS